MSIKIEYEPFIALDVYFVFNNYTLELWKTGEIVGRPYSRGPQHEPRLGVQISEHFKIQEDE